MSGDSHSDPIRHPAAAWRDGLLGVIIFSGSLPATRVAVADFSPVFLTSVRAGIAALLGGTFLLLLRQARPMRRDLLPLATVALGVVIGFPLMTALALQHTTSAHSLVFIGLLPLATAIFGVWRGGERPQPAFWVFSILGAASVSAFALAGSDSGSTLGGIYMVAAVLLCAFGYVEGAKLTRRLGGWQVISWALLLSLPLMVVIGLFTLPDKWSAVSARAWIGLAYISIFSMFLGFVFWYRGLAAGGVAGVGQLQLLQPFFGLLLAAVLLHEPVSWSMIASASFVVACVAGTKHFV